MTNLLANLTSIFEAGSGSSFLGASLVWKFLGSFFSLLWGIIRDALYRFAWWVVEFIFGAMEAFEFMINQFLGIGTTVNDMYNYLTLNDQQFLNILSHTFRAILAVSVLLVIIFTIFSLIRQDWKNAFDDNGGSQNGAQNDKKIVLIKAFKNIIIMFMLPVVMLILISGVNSVLTSFSNALKQGADVTVAGQVLASSTYDTNRYRKYAESDRRIPITLTAYNADIYGPDQNDMLEENIKDLKVQQKLLDTATMYANGSFLTFKNSLEYKNNTLVNSKNFGDYYETFICTPEQYQVMADFIDYAELHNLEFYIKAIDEKDIDWRYVDSSIFDPSTNSLKITYRDASDLDSDSDINDSYTITYQMSYSVTSPISDAFKSLLALLGIDEYDDNLFKEMEREEDSVNLVNWANEKVLLKLSEDFDYNNKSSWTDTDQIIMYEFYHYEIDNNDLGKYSIEDLKSGVELDAYEISTSNFVNGLYTGDTLTDCVLINDSYYHVELSETETDLYGNKYYVLSSIDGGYFLENTYTTIERVMDGENGVTTTLSFSEDFDVHNPETWTYGDQILVYEYYRYNTNLGESGGLLGQGADSNLRRYFLSRYQHGRGVPFNVYYIENYSRNSISDNYTRTSYSYYVKLNYTFYQVDENTYKLFNGDSKDINFLSLASQDISTFYAYNVATDSKFGLETGLVSQNESGENVLDFDQRMIYEGIDSQYFKTEYDEFIESLRLNEQEQQRLLKLCELYEVKGYSLSSGFKFNDVTTWTYRDFYIYYMFLTYKNFGDGINIEGLQLSGLPGKLGYLSEDSTAHAGELVVSVPYMTDTGVAGSLYLPLEKIMNISEEYMLINIDVTSTFNSNKFYSVGGDPLFFDNNMTGGYDVYALPLITETFNLSEGFNINNVADWTVGDLILYSLSVEGSIQSISLLRSNGYRALVYEDIIDNGDGSSTTDRVYRFGPQATIDATPYYISDSQIKQLEDIKGNNLKIDSVTSWLNMPLLDFICLKYGIEENSLYADLSGIVNSIYNSNFAANIEYADDVIGEILAEKGINVLENPEFLLSTNIESYIYKRATDYSVNDISTWTYLDLILYYLDSSNADSENINVNILSNGGNKYIVLDDTCIQIDNNVTFTSDYQLISSSANVNISSLIHLSTDADFEQTASNLYLYIDNVFKYTYTGTDQNILEKVLRSIYDENGVNLQANVTTISGKIYNSADGIDKYLQLAVRDKIYYIELSAGQIYFSNNSEIKISGTSGIAGKPLQNSGTSYTPFSGGKYSLMDAIYYYYSSDKNERNNYYTIYRDNAGNNYFVYNGMVLKYYSALASTYDATAFVTTIQNLFANGAAPAGSANEMLDSVAEYLNYFYDNFYTTSVNVDGTKTVEGHLHISFDINDVKTWSPIEILLYKHNLLTAPEEGSTLIEEDLTRNIVTDYYNNTYFEVQEEVYIKTSGLCNLNAGTQTLSNGTIDNDSAMLLMYMNIILTTNPQNYNSLKVERVEDIGSVTSTINNYYNNFVNVYIANLRLNGNLLIGTYVSEMDDKQSRKAGAMNMSLTDPATWSYFSMLYFQMTGNLLRTTDVFYTYINSDGEEYISFMQTQGGQGTFYFKVSTDKFVSRGTTTVVTFGESLESLTPLSIIVYNITKKTSVTVYDYSIDGYEVKSFQNITGDYIFIKDVGDEGISYAVSDETFEYEMFKTENAATNRDAFTWSLFEYLMLYDYGSIANQKFISKIFYVAGNYYFSLGSNDGGIERYINITNLISDKMHFDEDSGKVVVSEDSVDLETYLNANDKLNLIEQVNIKDYAAKEYWKQTPDTFKEFELSDGFVCSNPLTWTLRDFIIYYMFTVGGYIDGIDYFQEIINFGISAVEGYIIDQDRYGNVSYHHVLCFTSDLDNYKELTNYVYFDTFLALSTAILPNYSTVYNNDIKINMTIRGSAPSSRNRPTSFTYMVVSNGTGFNVNEYYYYQKDSEFWGAIGDTAGKFMDGNLSAAFRSAILNGSFDGYTMAPDAKHELKLSAGFDISNPATWTINDVIILVEYANSAIINNDFTSGDFDKLKNEGVTTTLFSLQGTQEGGFIVNGTVYSYYYKGADGNVYDVNTLLSTALGEGKNPLKAVEDSEGNINVFYGTTTFNILPNAVRTYEPSNAFRPHEEGNKQVYINRDSNMYMNYQIILNLLNLNTISPKVREVNWPQKLINDMQVLYPDLNWNTLLATKGWLDTLGEFTSAYTTGTYIADGNSSNITAAGLVLSEFFLSVASENEYSDLSDYTYSSIFDADTIKALMLAMLGEYEYENVYLQAKIFMDMYNTMFAPVLEDIADGSGIEIKDGNVENLKMCVYKSYLATVLLGSDMGEYFYKIATRVYAQYTIYESFAIAGGDYANYYAYINNLRGEDGQRVKAFMYSTFKDLVIYENKQAGLVAPTFTFNYNNAFQRYKNEIGANNVKEDSSFTYFNEVLEKLDDEYSRIYISNGSRVSENDGIYCFMLDAYWQICQDVGGQRKAPVYAELYHSYIMGELGRWNIVSNVDVTNTESSIRNYNSYRFSLLMTKASLVLDFLKIYMSLDVSVRPSDNIDEMTEDLEQELGDQTVEINTPYGLLNSVFSNSIYYKMFKDSFQSGGVGALVEILNFIVGVLGGSESGNVNNWTFINDMEDNLETLLTELSKVMKLQTNAVTENGAIKADYSDESYKSAYNKLQSLKGDLQTYINTQNKIDGIVKSSITFTLKQFGQNYVPDGYKLNIGNKIYNLQAATTSTRRLAEYVYGGEFLVNYGVYPEFTSADFDGFITTSKEYDSNLGIVRTRLNVWSDLREFGSALADYTSRLYFLSNFNDLASNVSDAVYLTDYVNVRGENRKVTIEQMILNYLVQPGDDESKISTDTLINILYKDTLPIVQSMVEAYTGNKGLIVKLAEYAQSKTADATFTEEVKREAIAEYISFVASNAYTSQGRYAGANQSERMHEMFKAIMSYLLINEETEEEEKKTINLDDITFKDLKLLLIKNIVDYKQNPTETAKENSARYLALFNLISCQVNYFYLDSDNRDAQVRIGTTIGNAYMARETVVDRDGQMVRTGNIMYRLSESKVYNVLADFTLDTASRNMVIEMARIANRPIESLVNLEYDELYDMKGNYDEANGDTFIICYYDDYIGKYIPYLTLNYNNSIAGDDRLYDEYKKAYPFRVTSDYCPLDAESSVPMPIVAKGMITTAGKPTAIRIEDYQVKFYRTDVTATMTIDNDALNRTRFTGETNTVKYVNYVDTTLGSAAQGFGSSSRQANFISESDISYFVNSDINPYYMQQTMSYSYSDETGKISVLDSLAVFFELNNMTFIMIAIGISATMPVLFKGTAAVLRRILDLLMLTLIGPFVLSMNTLDYDEKQGGASPPAKAYQQWRDYITQTLLFVFGYIAGLNIYYILISTVTRMTFVSAQTVQTIQSIGGLSFLSASVLNFVVKFLFIAVAAGTIQGSADLLVNIVTAGKVTSAFNSPMGGDVMEKIIGKDENSILGQMKSTANKAKDIYTGKAMVQAGAAAMEFGKGMVPGGALIGKGVDAVKSVKTKAEAKSLESLAVASGISPEAAKAFSKQYVAQMSEQREAKKQRHRNNVKGFTEKHELASFLNEAPKKKKDDDKKKSSSKKNKSKKKNKKKKNKSSDE